METWNAFPAYEDCYEISDEGRVRRSAPPFRWPPGTVMIPQAKPDGYLRVMLHRLGDKPRSFYIHRAVLIAFLGPPPHEKAEVNHKDGDKANNRVENLEWVSRSENLTHAIRVLGRTQPRGEKHGMSRLTEDKVREIRRSYAAGEENQVALARRFDVDQTTVWRVLHRRVWAHVS